ncbi:MAG: VOC family protein [Chitinophagales bacterium]
MATQIFVNLPVKDLTKSVTFYEAIGFTNNPQFTDESGACMVISDTIYVMLITHTKFKEFNLKDIIDGKKTAGVINSLSMNNNEEVNAFMEKALQAGGNEYRPAQDFGFMQLRSFEDPDGHNWEVFYMDMSKFPKQ